MLKKILEILTILMICFFTNTTLGQTPPPQVKSIELKPISDDKINKTILLNIYNTTPETPVLIEGSHDLKAWNTLGQTVVKQGQAQWETKQAINLPSYFFRVRINHAAETLKDGVYAEIVTNHGVILAKLEYKKVPLIVANFIGLAEGMKFYNKDNTKSPINQQANPFYDGLLFHRVIKDFMIQGGCPNGDGTGNPSYFLPDQFHPDLKHDAPGILSMANSGEHTNGSQFFITHKATPWLDFNDSRAGNHSVFGKVIKGLEVIDKIANVSTDANNKPTKTVYIQNIKIIRQGDEAKTFESTEDAINLMLQERAEQQMNQIHETLNIEPTESGLIFEDLKEGTGQKVKITDTVTFKFVAELTTEVNPFGRVFADSINPPFKISIAELAKVLPGAAEGLMLMKKGGHALLHIPPSQAYGKEGNYFAQVPPYSIIIMEILLSEIEP